MNYVGAFLGSNPILSFPQSVMTSSWSRPAAWLPITPVSASEKRFVGLYGVTNDSQSYVALTASGSNGYIVNWGDGSTQVVATGNTASHAYVFSNLSAFTAFTHSSGEIMRQAVVTVVPSGSGTLTYFGLNIKYPKTGLQNSITNWLDVSVGSPNFASGRTLVISDATPTVIHGRLESVHIQDLGSITDMAYMFNGCFKLRRCEISGSTSAVGNMTQMFLSCFALQFPPMMDTSNVTNMANMFQACVSMVGIPKYNTSKNTNFYYMFRDCSSLQVLPPLDFSKSTNTLNNTFGECKQLRYIPQLNTTASTGLASTFSGCTSLLEVPTGLSTSFCTDFRDTFNSCRSLTKVPYLDTSKGTQFSTMFTACTALKEIPSLNLQSGSTVAQMFQNCYALEKVPQLDTAKCTNFSNMFTSCYSLQTVPPLNTQSGSNFNAMYQNCNSLVGVPTFSGSALTSAANIANIFNGCVSMTSGSIVGSKYTISYNACKLDRTALVDIFNNLATVTGQTITITNNPGTADLTAADRLIATNKGWTITG